MSIRIHQALYGERERGHGLIAADSGAPELVVRQLEGWTDLPASPPSSMIWEPYLSGFPLGEWYVIARTGPDPAAARGGMVLTHVLLVPRDVIGKLGEVQTLFSLLPERPTRRSDLPHLELPVASLESGDSESDAPAPPGLARLVHELLASSAGGAVGWIGEEGFAPAVAALWRNLWPAARQEFRFRLSFRPADLGTNPPTVVIVPAAAELWWQGRRLVRSTDLYTPKSRAEAFLLGLPEGDPLWRLLDESGGRLGPLRDLLLLERTYVRLERLSENSLDEVRALARLLGNLSPEADKGTALKERVLSRLEKLTRDGDTSGIRALENFDPAPFPQGHKVLSGAVRDWVRAAVLNGNRLPEMGSLVERAFSVAVPGWSDAVRDALVVEFTEWRSDHAPMLWAWWSHSPTLVKHLESLIPARSSAEEDLARACPTRVPDEAGKLVRDLARNRRWWRVHAAAAASSLSSQAAIDAHLAVDRRLEIEGGVRVLAARLPPRDLLQGALRTSDPRLIKAVADACAETPTLRAGLDVNSATWREIWLESMRGGGDPWSGIPDPQQTMDRLLGLVLGGEEVAPSLLEILAKTPQGDLTEYPRRTELWAHLYDPASRALVEATAEGWLQRFARDPGMEADLEPQLRSAIVDRERLKRHLSSETFHQVHVGVTFFERLGIGEDLFLSWLGRLLGAGVPLARADAEALGGFISRKKWGAAAGRIADALRWHRRNDLIPAAVPVLDLLNIFTRLHLSLHGLWSHDRASTDDWWQVLVDVAAELYRYGPRDRSIWERAGGDPADLDLTGDGRQQWRAAIGRLKQGGGGRVTRERLVAEMLVDFSNNEKLQTLYQVRRSRG